MALLQQTTVTFGEAKRRIAESTGSTANDDALAKAGRSLQAAFRHWNNVANWKWLRKTVTATYKPFNPIGSIWQETYQTVANQATYAAPYDMKAIHSIRMTSGLERTLDYIDRRTFNKAFSRRDIVDKPYLYDLFTQYGNNAEGGVEDKSALIRLYPTPAGAETFEVDYYRRMVIPCAITVPNTTLNGTPVLTTTHSGGFAGVQVGTTAYHSQHLTDGYIVTHVPSLSKIQLHADTTSQQQTHSIIFGGDDKFLDCPEDYVEGIIAMATHHYLINKAGAPRLEYWQVYAQQELERALRENMSDTPDEEICFLPPYVYASPTLSPNDIRWADMGY